MKVLLAKLQNTIALRRYNGLLVINPLVKKQGIITTKRADNFFARLFIGGFNDK